MIMRLLHLTALIIVLIVCESSTEDWGTKTRCIPLRDCPSLLNLLKQQPLTPETVNFLQSSNCGFEGNHPKVRCRINNKLCTTPDGISGTCLPIRKCVPFLQVLQESNLGDFDTSRRLRQFQCNNSVSDIEVCCAVTPKIPTDPPIISTTTRRISTQKPITTTPRTLPVPNHLPRPSSGECGIQNVINKIFGGTTADLDEFPWTVLLQYRKGDKLQYGCGGSLISNRYVLTAAHCVDRNAVRRNGNVAAVVLGEYDTQTEQDCVTYPTYQDCADPSYTVDVQEVIVHQQWEAVPALLNDDIALLRLNRPVTFSEYVQPICLPSPTLTLKDGEEVIVAGWGQTETAKSSNVKLKTKVPIFNKAQCVRTYREKKRLSVGNGLLCAGGQEGKDSCTGDSGGPLMVPIERGSNIVWFLAGVVSFGPNPCGVEKQPALYTNVAKYVDWIYNNTRP